VFARFWSGIEDSGLIVTIIMLQGL